VGVAPVPAHAPQLAARAARDGVGNPPAIRRAGRIRLGQAGGEGQPRLLPAVRQHPVDFGVAVAVAGEQHLRRRDILNERNRIALAARDIHLAGAAVHRDAFLCARGQRNNRDAPPVERAVHLGLPSRSGGYDHEQMPGVRIDRDEQRLAAHRNDTGAAACRDVQHRDHVMVPAAGDIQPPVGGVERKAVRLRDLQVFLRHAAAAQPGDLVRAVQREVGVAGVGVHSEQGRLMAHADLPQARERHRVEAADHIVGVISHIQAVTSHRDAIRLIAHIAAGRDRARHRIHEDKLARLALCDCDPVARHRAGPRQARDGIWPGGYRIQLDRGLHGQRVDAQDAQPAAIMVGAVVGCVEMGIGHVDQETVRVAARGQGQRGQRVGCRPGARRGGRNHCGGHRGRRRAGRCGGGRRRGRQRRGGWAAARVIDEDARRRRHVQAARRSI